MDIITIYDAKTTLHLVKLEELLEEYKKQLKVFIDVKTKGYTCSRDITDEFENDPGKRKIENEIANVKKLTRPIKFEIVYHLHDMIMELGFINHLVTKRQCDYENNINPYKFSDLNKQSLKIPYRYIETFLSGEEIEAIYIADRFGCRDLHNFLNDIIEGGLRDTVYYKLQTI
jgi:hypothetical protein